jgi:prolyl-tRNA synthetase
VRIELGPRDIEQGKCVAARRDTLEKTELLLDDTLPANIEEILNNIQQNLYDRALLFRQENTVEVSSWEEFKAKVEKGFVIAHWDGTAETEALIKEETKATIRVMPMDAEYRQQYSMDEPGTCIRSGNPATQKVVFAKAY